MLPEERERFLGWLHSAEERRDVETLLDLDRNPVVRQEGAVWQCYLVDHCDVLVVLPGGSPEVERLATEKKRPVLRVSFDAPLQRVTGNGLNARSIARLEMLNELRLDEGDRAVADEKHEEEYLDPKVSECRNVSVEARRLVREKLFPYYTRASLIAKENQATYRRAGKLVWVLFPITVGAVALGTLHWRAPSSSSSGSS